MMRVLTAEEMREADRVAIEEIGVPGLVLMENAALGVVEVIGERFPEATSVAVFYGPGNNGGDGLAVARHLVVRGYGVSLFALGGELSGDAGVQETICRRLGLSAETVASEDDVPAAVAEAAGCDLILDALFGTGLSRPLKGRFARLVEELNRLAVPRLAVDLPSGLYGGEAGIPGPHLEAGITVTFAAPKVAQVLEPAASAVGELVVTDLGVPGWLTQPQDGPGLYLLLEEDLAAYLQPRAKASHKGSYGHLLLVAGGPGKAGAAILAARSAVRAGAGLVTAAVPCGQLAVVDGGSLESMTLACAETEDGQLAPAAVDELLAVLRDRDALALGPGLGVGEETEAAIRRLVLEATVPLVLDADGLNAFAGHAAALARRSAPTVLTPHPGELGRLLQCSAAEVQEDRPAAARRAAELTGAVVLLKGHRTLVATPDGELYINTTGNPGMATGGTGDVLTGLVGGLLAQGMEALAAAQLGAFCHGLAGDLASEELGERGLAAGDLLDRLPKVLQRLARA
ncbi:MAG: NAD(P)H-hydrate dehydratase [Acidobacteriota bacterium]|nr:NAD(P)H-hydrate dehydratase [Acidobacteriota bacterium]